MNWKHLVGGNLPIVLILGLQKPRQLEEPESDAEKLGIAKQSAHAGIVHCYGRLLKRQGLPKTCCFSQSAEVIQVEGPRDTFSPHDLHNLSLVSPSVDV